MVSIGVLIEESSVRQKDLVPIFKTESIVSDVLKGKRKLTVEHIQKLGEFFNVSPAEFFPINSSSRTFWKWLKFKYQAVTTSLERNL